MCIKDTWTKPRGVGIREGKWGWLGLGGVVRGKCRQLYLNNNKIILKKQQKKKSPDNNYVYLLVMEMRKFNFFFYFAVFYAFSTITIYSNQKKNPSFYQKSVFIDVSSVLTQQQVTAINKNLFLHLPVTFTFLLRKMIQFLL